MVVRHYKLTTFGETKRFLRLNDVLCDLISFKEKLYVYNEDGRRVGRFSITVKDVEIQKCRALMVHISNRAILKGATSESMVTGVLTQNLKTLEEIRYEASEMGNGKHERRFYLLRERTKYYYSVTQSVCSIEHKRHKTISFTKSIGLIGEASNVLLMRAIAIRGYEGILCLKTILSNGKKCRNYYVSKCTKRMMNNSAMDVVVIYRSVTNHKKYSVTSTCTFTRAGQMIDLFWSNSNYFLHIDPDLEISCKRVTDPDSIGLHRHWNRDKQIFSYYLDKKTEYHASNRSYRLRMTQTKRAGADWFQTLLMLKPDDVVASTIHYFCNIGDDPFQKFLWKTKSPKDEKLEELPFSSHHDVHSSD